MFGFRNGTRFKENMDDLDRFLKHEAVDLVPIGKITSDRYSRIAVKLRQQGTPIPTNDIWIAAHTMETGAELISFDEHFGATWAWEADPIAAAHLMIDHIDRKRADLGLPLPMYEVPYAPKTTVEQAQVAE